MRRYLSPPLRRIPAFIRHWRLSLKFSLLLASGLLAAASSNAAQASETVTIQLKWLHQFQFAGYYAAQDQGYYREAGLEVKLLEARPGHDSLQAVMQGEAQYGIGNTALLAARARGLPVVVLASLYQHSAAALLVRRDAGGKPHLGPNSRIMLAPNNEELALFLRKYGIPTESLLPVAHNFSYGDLLDGNIDAMSVYTTEAPYILEHSSLGYQILTPRSQGDDFYGDVLYTTESELRDHPRRAAALRAATLRGWAYAMQHPDELVDLIRARYPQRHSRELLLYEAQHIVPLLAQDSIELGYSDPLRWQAIADSYMAQGMLPEDFKLEGFLYQPEQQQGWRRHLPVLLPVLVLLLIAALLWRMRHRLLPAHRPPHSELPLAGTATPPGSGSSSAASPATPTSSGVHAVAVSQRTLQDAGADALLLLDPDGKIRAANPRARQLLAQAAAPAGQLCWPALRADGSPYDASNHPLQLALLTAAPVTDAIIGLPTPAGSVLWLLANIELVADERRAVSALAVSLRPAPVPAHAAGPATAAAAPSSQPQTAAYPPPPHCAPQVPVDH
ncbi:ABC transporter substrate-binding protein [Pseudoduganella sp. FT93W]|uniref:Thiamine pyrimidine synthase n=2 Tax=Duganella fentianensis TaxID=2692177 RepID=A0A845HZ22_9BURK|nr:ABC transporter substrate-binding protein [Duganella fentianensis]